MSSWRRGKSVSTFFLLCLLIVAKAYLCNFLVWRYWCRKYMKLYEVTGCFSVCLFVCCCLFYLENLTHNCYLAFSLHNDYLGLFVCGYKSFTAVFHLKLMMKLTTLIMVQEHTCIQSLFPPDRMRKPESHL